MVEKIWTWEGEIEENGKMIHVRQSVELERWAWCVVYKDGTVLQQFGHDLVFHKFAEIRQQDVKVFAMYETSAPSMREARKLYAVAGEGVQIFHFYRNTILNANTDDERRIRIQVFGTKKDGVANYNYILPDGRVITAIGDINVLECGIDL